MKVGEVYGFDGVFGGTSELKEGTAFPIAVAIRQKEDQSWIFINYNFGLNRNFILPLSQTALSSLSGKHFTDHLANLPRDYFQRVVKVFDSVEVKPSSKSERLLFSGARSVSYATFLSKYYPGLVLYYGESKHVFSPLDIVLLSSSENLEGKVETTTKKRISVKANNLKYLEQLSKLDTFPLANPKVSSRFFKALLSKPLSSQEIYLILEKIGVFSRKKGYIVSVEGLPRPVNFRLGDEILYFTNEDYAREFRTALGGNLKSHILEK